MNPSASRAASIDSHTGWPSFTIPLEPGNVVERSDTSGLWPSKVVTEVTPIGTAWEAEPEHQDYLIKHPNGYTCHYVRPPGQLPHQEHAG
ncbi:hypothetical protein Psi02_62750 [Planotetraspora silvatica]|uniref:peptide-methionine (S)-S-oxide reductase n=1 Tax=Planotetraspora silvatica TaxID=234614 RepID=A0A8J3XRV8_9ACTN|nr:peptide-methionine (S)-S-oxide reductase [Planotetraspora silvatica]GII49851.1 hypothetical protein Psi02_62750 [Planotetraspora silvatica]